MKIFVCVPTYIAYQQRTGVAFVGAGAASVGLDGHAVGISQSHRPHPRPGRPGITRVEKRVAGYPVAGVGIDTQYFTTQRTNHLRPQRTHIFCGPHHSFVDCRLGISSTVITYVYIVVTGVVTSRDKQRTIAAEQQ